MSVHPLIDLALRYPRAVKRLTWVVTVCLLLLAALPSLWPGALPALHGLHVDTDPENMLPADDPARRFHRDMKRELALHDMLVVGVIDESHPQGVFNVRTLRNVHALTHFARGLRWPDASGREVGVITADLVAPSNVDSIEPDGPGTVRFEWLMPEPPRTEAEALAIRDRALRLPFLNGTLVSEDGQALALYIPITSKAVTYEVYSRLEEKIATLEGGERYHITGIPVAEDAFGVEMFVQMAISAPLAMLVIFLMMYLMFRKAVLIVPAMLVAMVSVLCTMSLLVVTGHTVHIMSSMIPIFIMPIAVLDAVHILSQFFDRHRAQRDLRETVAEVMDGLYKPMLYTSLTTAAGFASLTLAPIPPVQVFGVFVAVGVMLAWLLTITFIPAFILGLRPRALADFGLQAGRRRQVLGPLLHRLGEHSYRWARLTIVLTLVAGVLAAVGIGRIVVNDNPVRWFEHDHPIRVADRELNAHFGGTYMAFLAFEPRAGDQDLPAYARALDAELARRAAELSGQVPFVDIAFDALRTKLATTAAPDRAALLEGLHAFATGLLDEAEGDLFDAWDEAVMAVDAAREREQVFKQPEAIAYLAGLQGRLAEEAVVGKTTSIADIVKTVHRELHVGDPQAYRVPASPAAVAQTLMTFQNGHRPQDLWHFTTPDFRTAGLWLQLKSGDNVDMSRVVSLVEDYVSANPPPFDLAHRWFGLTYINLVWQEQMVWGMLEALLGSFLIVFLMMLLLLRSGLWALLSMLPLTVTIGLIYGIIGYAGKAYDMPVAVLSALSLGLAVDFAIHFLVRARTQVAESGSWALAAGTVFGAPARAITRNAVVIIIGFLPLLLAPLVPYKTVGVLIAAILLVSAVTTLFMLPALIRVLEPWLFPRDQACTAVCNYVSCSSGLIAVIGVVAVNAHGFLGLSWSTLLPSLAAAGTVAFLACRALTRRRAFASADRPATETQT